MSESELLNQKQKKATDGVVFLTIFMDMVGFSVIFPLFPAMLDHYLSREAAGDDPQTIAQTCSTQG